MAASQNRVYYQGENGKLFQMVGETLMETDNIKNKKIILSASLDIKCYLSDLKNAKEKISTMLVNLHAFSQKFPNSIIKVETILKEYNLIREFSGHLRLLEEAIGENSEAIETFPIIISSKSIDNYMEQHLLAVLQLIDLQQYLNKNNDAMLIIPISLCDTLSTSSNNGVTTLYNRVLNNFEKFNAEIELELFRTKLMVVTEIKAYMKTPCQSENNNMALVIARTIVTSKVAEFFHHRHEHEANDLIYKILTAADKEKLKEVLKNESKQFAKGGYKKHIDAALKHLEPQQRARQSMENN